MDEHAYERLANHTFRRIEDMFEQLDPDDADIEASGDVLRIQFRGARPVIVNTQRPVRQIWLAGGQRAWHFSYDEAKQAWFDDKGHGDELFATLIALGGQTGVTLVAPAG
jgi:CyaY protein